MRIALALTTLVLEPIPTTISGTTQPLSLSIDGRPTLQAVSGPIRINGQEVQIDPNSKAGAYFQQVSADSILIEWADGSRRVELPRIREAAGDRIRVENTTECVFGERVESVVDGSCRAPDTTESIVELRGAGGLARVYESLAEAVPPARPRAHRLWFGVSGIVTDTGWIATLGYAVDRSHWLGADLDLALGTSQSKANGDIQESSSGLAVQTGIAARIWRRDGSRGFLPWLEAGFFSRASYLSEFLRKPVPGTSGTQGVHSGGFQFRLGARARAIPLVIEFGSRHLWVGTEVAFAPVRLGFDPEVADGGLNASGSIGLQFGLSI